MQCCSSADSAGLRLSPRAIQSCDSIHEYGIPELQEPSCTAEQSASDIADLLRLGGFKSFA